MSLEFKMSAPTQFDYQAEFAYYSNAITQLQSYEWLDADMRCWIPDYPSVFKGKHILDIGAGEGLQAILIAERYAPASIIAMDLIPYRLQAANRHRCLQQLDKLVLLSGNCYYLPFEAEQFDLVMGNGILHHLPNLTAVIAEIARVLRSGGLYMGREPNFLNPLVNRRVLHTADRSKNEYALLPGHAQKTFQNHRFEVRIDHFWRRWAHLCHPRLAVSMKVCALKR